MAKCVGSVNKWAPRCKVIHEPEFISSDVRLGENLLKKRVEALDPLILDIVNDYLKIKQSALTGEDEFKLDCNQAQDALVKKLELLQEETTSVTACISSSDLIASTKHRYFIHYTYSFVEKLERLVQMTGRLSEIDIKLYLEEQRKLLISDESITLHSLVSIWTAVLEILDGFCRSAPPVFNPNPGTPANYDFLDQLEFSTARVQFARALLMDFIITSWIKFNRLVKYDDLAKGQPFLCQCHMKTFFNTMPLASKAKLDSHSDDNLEKYLCDMLLSILDYQCRPSMMTMSARRFGIIPLEPCYAKSSQSDLAYFLIWHLYSINRSADGDLTKNLITPSQTIMDKSFRIVSESFIPKGNQIKRLSPHQEERFKLIFLMLSSWIERTKRNVKLLTQMLEFAISVHKEVEEANYMDNSEFTINDLTLFYLFSKHFNETIPDYGTRTNGDKEPVYNEEEQTLINVWNTILDEHLKRKRPEQTVPPTN